MQTDIEMISVFGTDGSITPLRFRVKNEANGLETVSISKVVSEKQIQYAGIDAIHYLCRADFEKYSRLYELRYTLASHRWSIYRILY